MERITAKRLDGRAAAEVILKKLRRQVRAMKRKPLLATVMVGYRFDSALYVRLKVAAAKKVGVKTEQVVLPTSTTQTQLLTVLAKLNHRPDVSAILLQLPLPSTLNANQAIRQISLKKDADGFRPGRHHVTPPTVAAVLKLMSLGRPVSKGRAVLLSRRSVLARQMERRLRARGYAVKCISKKWSSFTKRADCIVTILGAGPRLKATDVGHRAVVIDVGIRRGRSGIAGDVDPSVWNAAKAVSPVPGGVGPLTVAYLLYNTVRLSRHQ